MIQSRLLTIDNIKEKFILDGYEVLSSNYITSKQKIEYKCPNGHFHSMRLDHWNRGIRCPYCSNKIKKSIEYIRPYIENDGYKLLSTDYKDAFSTLIVECNYNHVFSTTWHSWDAGGCRCPKCNGGVKRTTDEVREILNAEGYSLIGDYINSSTPVVCECPHHHEYRVLLSNFMSKKSRCTLCSNNGSSAGELILRDFLESNNIQYTCQNRKLIHPFELDIVIHDKQIAIEYCGLYWHSQVNNKNESYHINKLILCGNVGYTLITIFEDELLENKAIVLNKLKTLLNLNTTDSTYVYSTEVYVIDEELSELFFKNNCLFKLRQEPCITVGAFNNGTLLAVMSFRHIKIDTYELYKFCSLNNEYDYLMHDLFTYFKSNYVVNELTMIVDRRWNDHYIPLNLRFTFKSYLLPDYYLVKHKKRLNKESTNLVDSINKIWDCGQAVYTYFGETL